MLMAVMAIILTHYRVFQIRKQLIYKLYVFYGCVRSSFKAIFLSNEKQIFQIETHFQKSSKTDNNWD